MTREENEQSASSLRNITTEEKRCPRCGETDLKKFGKNRLMWDGLAYICKACDAKRGRERYANFTDEQLQAHLGRCNEYQRNNRRKINEYQREWRHRKRQGEVAV